MASDTLQKEKKQSFLEFFPTTLFGSVSATSSLSIAFGFINSGFGHIMKEVLAIFSLILFALLSIAFFLKIILHRNLIRKDLADPVGINLVGVFFIALMLISSILKDYAYHAAFYVWVFGAFTTFLFAGMVFSRWFDHRQNPVNALPVWVIPVLGVLDIPITGLSYPGEIVHEVSVLFFAVGLLLSLMLVTMILARLLFQAELTSNLQPTLMLLTSPFALVYSDYVLLNGRQDLFSSVLFYFALFLGVIFGRKLLYCLNHVHFTITWWAISFPLSALTVAAFRYASVSQVSIVKYFPLILLIISLTVLVVLVFQTIQYIAKRFYKNDGLPLKRKVTLNELLGQDEFVPGDKNHIV